MIWNQPEPEFRDLLLNSQPTLTQRITYTAQQQQHNSKRRMTWTNRVKRRQLHQQKLIDLQQIFNHTLPLRTPTTERNNQPIQTHKHYLTHSPPNRKIHTFLASWSHNCSPETTTRRKNSFSASHFALSRNIYQHSIHQDLSNSGILVDKYSNKQIKQNDSQRTNPQQFFKSLRIKNNINLYKGNFQKFKKKQLKRKATNKRCQLTTESELSPWQSAEKGSLCYR